MEKTDNKEKLLITALAHEFSRCTKDFNSFCLLASKLPDNNTKTHRIDCFNIYVDFLSHLYEFYIGLIKSDPKFKQKEIYKNYESFKNKQEHEIIDLIFNEEVGKLFRNRKNRILNGYADNLGYRIDFYECNIPEKFGEHFRYMRNRRNHVDYRRASNDYDISLKDFFENYHKFILILYYECVWLWHVNEDDFDWLAIDDFASEILKRK